MGEITKYTIENENIKNGSNSIIKGVTTPLGNKVAETIQSKFPIREDINTPESIEKIRNAFSFYKKEVLPLIINNQTVTQEKEGCHGLYTHTQNVVFRGISYAISLGKDPIPVIFACACHDLARKNDNRDTEHGKNAVPIAQEIMNNEKFILTEEQKNQIIDAIANHTEGKEASNYIAACLRDADRTRLSWNRKYNEKYFNTEQGKKIASGKREDFIKFQNLCVNIEGKDPDTITPEEFSLTLMNRADIKHLDEHLKEFKTFSSLSPEMVSLYDKIVELPRIQELSEENCKSFLKWLFSNISRHCDVKACLEIVPTLINEGYDLDTISKLAIREDNKDVIKNLLDDNEIIEILKKEVLKENPEYTNEDEEEEDEFGRKEPKIDIKEERKSKFIEKVSKISKSINIDNIKYLKICLELNVDTRWIPYFNEDTNDIIQKYLSGYEDDAWHIGEVLDRIHRRGHTLQSISNIFDDEPITPLTERLLEFKEFDKFKDIGIDEYKNLSTKDKKIFLNGFISALTPYDILYPDQYRGNEDFRDLQKRMKIFEELKWDEDAQARLNNYNDMIKILLDGIPDDERFVCNENKNLIYYRRQYREKNKIPPLVDDIEKVLEIHTENIKGRQVKVAELDFETDLGVSTHRFTSISSIEALEATDGGMLLVIGTNGGSRDLNVIENGYALIVKPKNIGNIYVQGVRDIDSGTGCMKNLYNFEHVMLPVAGDHCECISLVPNAIKQELNLSQEEYTKRINALGNVTTLQEVGERDKELELCIRRVLKKVAMYEGLITPTVMGIAIGKMDLNDVDEDILDYCVRRDIPLVKMKYPVKKESNKAPTGWEYVV